MESGSKSTDVTESCGGETEAKHQHLLLEFGELCDVWSRPLSNELIITQDEDEPQIFTVPCPTFPVFSLENCSNAIRKALGVTEDTLIETLDPRTSTSAITRWVSHELTTARTISDQESLLYRSRGVSKGKEMEEEVEKALSHGKSRKRPVDINPQAVQAASKAQGTTSQPQSHKRQINAIEDSASQGHDSRNVRPRFMKAPASPAPPSQPSLSGTSSRTTPTAQSSSPTPSPTTTSQSKWNVASSSTPLMAHDRSPSLPPIEEALHDLLSAVQHSTKQATSPSTSMNTTIDLTQTSGEDDVDEMMPSSGHATWPLKFVKSMSEGFLKMETMTGGLEYRFAVAFPSARTDKFPKASYNINSRVWEWAPEDLRNRYITAGYTNAGRWKDFAREVSDLYDGKVPGKRSAKDRKRTGDRVQVKKEKKVKVEPTEVIIIDDD